MNTSNTFEQNIKEYLLYQLTEGLSEKVDSSELKLAMSSDEPVTFVFSIIVPVDILKKLQQIELDRVKNNILL